MALSLLHGCSRRDPPTPKGLKAFLMLAGLVRSCRCSNWGQRRRLWCYHYHRRSLSETAMYRMKCCFGDHLKNRLTENQQSEARLRSEILNQFTHLGLPEFEWS